MKKKQASHTVYFGGELFDHKHLIGNAYLAEAIFERSHGRYVPLLPQNFELRGATAQAIRDQDLRSLVACDVALFHFDGSELDSGTVIEFMFAKAADIPAVIVRGDVRGGGDQRREPWNLMASFWPRTATVLFDTLGSYKTRVRRRLTPVSSETMRLAGQHASAHAQAMCEDVAAAVVRALDRVIASDPVMPKHLREEVYQWLALMPGLRGKEKALRHEFEQCLEQKVDRDLL